MTVKNRIDLVELLISFALAQLKYYESEKEYTALAYTNVDELTSHLKFKDSFEVLTYLKIMEANVPNEKIRKYKRAGIITKKQDFMHFSNTNSNIMIELDLESLVKRLAKLTNSDQQDIFNEVFLNEDYYSSILEEFLS